MVSTKLTYSSFAFVLMFIFLKKILIKWIINVKYVMNLSNLRAIINILDQRHIKKFDKCNHIDLTIENPNINNVDREFNVYIIQLNEKYDCYLIKCHFKLVFNDNQYSTYVKCNLFDNKTMISRQNFLEKVIDFKNKGYNFNHVEEMNIITIAKKVDIPYDFYVKHNMHAVEWKLNAMINKNKSLINKFSRSWRQPLNGKFRRFRV